METHRINGIKYDFERLSTDELENIHGHLLTQHQRVTDEIGVVEGALFSRNHEQLPLDRIIGRTCLENDTIV